ncbi:MAG: hypothetical protein Ct9H300mP19_11060 [Dehalococcoidia bacterium]|nr:MAG: hypothetical protein Ct9H300mP19_11060 [Dehalococcoidia bacterium]
MLAFQSHDFGSPGIAIETNFFYLMKAFSYIELSAGTALCFTHLLSLSPLTHLINQITSEFISFTRVFYVCFVCNLHVRKAVLISKFGKYIPRHFSLLGCISAQFRKK